MRALIKARKNVTEAFHKMLYVVGSSTTVRLTSRKILSAFLEKPFEATIMFEALKEIINTNPFKLVYAHRYDRPWETELRSQLNFLIEAPREFLILIISEDHHPGFKETVEAIQQGKIYNIRNEYADVRFNSVTNIEGTQENQFLYYCSATNSILAVLIEKNEKQLYAEDIFKAFKEATYFYILANLDKVPQEIAECAINNYENLDFINEQLIKRIEEEVKEASETIGKQLLIEEINYIRRDIKVLVEDIESHASIINNKTEEIRSKKAELSDMINTETESFDELKAFLKLPQVVALEFSNANKLVVSIITKAKVEEEYLHEKILGVDARGKRILRLGKGLHTGELEINFVGAFSINLVTGETELTRQRAKELLNAVNFQGNYCLNPHHDQYSCLGTFRNELQRSANAKAWFGLALVIIEATASLNLLDNAVMASFLSDLVSGSQTTGVVPKFYYPKEQKYITIHEYEQIKEAEAREEQTQEQNTIL